MAATRPSTAPLFRDLEDYSVYSPDYSTAGEGFVPVIRGTNQFLGTQGAAHHDGEQNLGPRSNRVQAGQLPLTQSRPIGAPSKVNPAGRGL